MNTTKDWNKSIIEEFRANEGKVGGYFKNSTLLLLHTTGAKSGKARINPLMYLKVRDRFLVIASNKGGETNPAWYYNIVANPDVAVEVGTEKI
jgi:deazaflavin-dependent oxidoreductase (nitroreductase family)